MSANSSPIDTIFAQASAQGRAGVSIMRVSGSQTQDVIKALCRSCPAPRYAGLREIRHPETGESLDKGLVLWFPGPRSFTGEDMAELHVHGSLAVMERLSEALFYIGLRQAKAGEFTRRAFENGRMDLTEAEGLADLIDAQTRAQHKQAYRQMEGGLRQTYEGWRGLLIEALALIEGEIDFPDEGDIPDDLAHKAQIPLSKLSADLQKTLADASRGERVRHGLDIAIIGAPNAGKSSLINKLANRNVAIVSPIKGTTRDIVEAHVEIAGLEVRLSDTAGLRESEDSIEREGIARAIKRAQDADIRIGLIDVSDISAQDLQSKNRPIDEIDDIALPFTSDVEAFVSDKLHAGDFLIFNKSDLISSAERKIIDVIITRYEKAGLATYVTSIVESKNLNDIYAGLQAEIASRFGVSEMAGLTRMRHQDCVKRALKSVEAAQNIMSTAPELAGEDLRSALHAIKELAGETDIEAVLDLIFTRFCVGK